MPVMSPNFKGNISASWDNPPYIDDASNIALLGPKPPGYTGPSYSVYQSSVAGTPGWVASPGTNVIQDTGLSGAVSTAASLLTPSATTVVAPHHKTWIYIAVAVVAVVIIGPKLLKGRK